MHQYQINYKQYFNGNYESVINVNPEMIAQKIQLNIL